MTAYRCCPGCGAELPADQHATGGCACTGPFTEVRDDPLHIRPYVDLPGSVDSGDTGPESGTVGNRPQPDLTPFARCGTAETAELPAVPAQSVTPEQSATPEQPRRRRAPAGAPRRRPGNAVLAGAGMAAALGAGLLCANVLTGSDGGGGDTRSLSAGDRAADPEPELGSGQAPAHDYPSGERANPHSAQASSTADGPRARTAPATPRADRDSGVHTTRPTPSRSASTPSASASDGSTAHPDRSIRPSASSAGTGDDGGGDRSAPQTLRAGDSGAQVRELQQRLKQAGFLDQDAPEDGQYSAVVQEAVFRYQTANGVRGDAAGEYGPQTRASLESRTTD